MKCGIIEPFLTSCSTCNIDIWDGILNCPPEIILNNVVLPNPLRPTKPYLLPNANTMSAPCNNTLQNNLATTLLYDLDSVRVSESVLRSTYCHLN